MQADVATNTALAMQAKRFVMSFVPNTLKNYSQNINRFAIKYENNVPRLYKVTVSIESSVFSCSVHISASENLLMKSRLFFTVYEFIGNLYGGYCLVWFGLVGRSTKETIEVAIQ